MVTTISHLNYCERLKFLKLPSLQYRRHMYRGDMITLFNLINNMHDLNSSDFITPSITNHNTRGHNFKLHKPQMRIDIRKFSFTRRIVTDWNNLPNYVVNANSTDDFKKLFDNFNCNIMYHFVS